MSSAIARSPALRLLIVGVATLAWLTSAGAASAATFTVTQTADTSGGTCLPGSCSLRQALAAVANGDTVILPASASPYTLTNGQLMLSKGITLQGAGASSSVIEAQDSDRVMLINGNSTAVRLANLTITGGSTTKAGGGGIASAGPGPLLLTSVAVSGNHVTPSASGFNLGGGGIFSRVPVTLSGSVVSNNTVTVTQSNGDSGGGGILIAQTAHGADLKLSDSILSGNLASVSPAGGASTDNNGGGGIYQDGADLSITGSLVQGNTATVTGNVVGTPADGGGGIYQFGTSLLVQDSTIAGNVAHGPGVDKGGGGGVFDDGDNSQYVNSTIANNSTDEPAATGPDTNSDGGGGILFDTVNGGVVMANMTITGNSASAATGGGLNSFLTTPIVVTDSVIAANHSASGGGNCAGPVQSEGYNVADDTTSNSCSLTAAGDLLRTSVGLGPLTNNGGPTPTEALLAGSPAIDAGNPSGCTDLLGNSVLTDQRGVARPQPPNGHCDIGAYERALPVVTAVGQSVVNGKPTLTATVANPDPRAGNVVFQFGRTSNYGSSTAAKPLPGSSAGSSFAVAPSGLQPGRTYHFRVVATNPAGSSSSTDRRFKAAKLAPRRFSAKVKPSVNLSAVAQFVISGRLRLPAGVSKSVGCQGSVSVKAKLQGMTLATVHTHIGHSCRYRAKLTLGRHGPGAHVVQVTVRFRGNSALLGQAAQPLSITIG